MKSPSVKLLIAMLAVLAAMSFGFFSMGQPVHAQDSSSDKLIDSEFENCLRAKLQKRFFNRIDATPPQREELSELMKVRMEETRPLREEVRRKVVDLAQLLPDKSVSDEEITGKVKEIQSLRLKVMDQRASTLVKVRKILTADQLQQISDRITGFITGEWKPRRLGMLSRFR